MPKRRLVLATRRSALALQQSNWVKARLEALHPDLSVELLEITTTGDQLRHQPLPEIGGKGLFTRELEAALLEGRAHLAVHSLKDLPTDLPAGLTLAAVPAREDPRDAWVARIPGTKFSELPPGARVGTSSLRRAAQIRHARPDLRIESLRGNLDTRLRKLREGSLDGIVVAAAGLKRMGWADQATELFSPELLCPAVGQGALGIEALADGGQTLALLAPLEDAWSRISVTAERALLKDLGGGCQVPIAAYTSSEDERIVLRAVIIHPDGSGLLRAAEYARGEIDLRAAEDLGRRAADNLISQGAQSILDQVAASSASAPAPQAP